MENRKLRKLRKNKQRYTKKFEYYLNQHQERQDKAIMKDWDSNFEENMEFINSWLKKEIKE